MKKISTIKPVMKRSILTGKLYLNKGNMQFENITQEAKVETRGWITGGLW